MEFHVDPPSGTILAKNIDWNNTALSSSWNSTYDNAFKEIYNNTVTGTNRRWSIDGTSLFSQIQVLQFNLMEM
ncbi:MAG: hypothetical protein IPN46_20175 [Saprospiraceae bacterium]|nr:hypothetical protein [Saprospiraceae bacterium]